MLSATGIESTEEGAGPTNGGSAPWPPMTGFPTLVRAYLAKMDSRSQRTRERPDCVRKAPTNAKSMVLRRFGASL